MLCLKCVRGFVIRFSSKLDWTGCIPDPHPPQLGNNWLPRNLFITIWHCRSQLKTVYSSEIWTRTFGIPVCFCSCICKDDSEIEVKHYTDWFPEGEFQSRSSQHFSVDFGSVRISWKHFCSCLFEDDSKLERLESVISQGFRVWIRRHYLRRSFRAISGRRCAETWGL